MNVTARQQEILEASIDSCLRTIAGAEPGKEEQVFTEWSRHAVKHALQIGWDKGAIVDRLDNAGQAIGLDVDLRQQILGKAFEVNEIVSGMERRANDTQHSPPSTTTPQQRLPRIKFERTTTPTIMSTSYPPLRAIVAGYLYEGFTVLAGRQKLGKTWLGIDWATAVATGGIAMGSIPCDQGDVLYIDMENGPRRIQGRINTLFPNERDRPDLSRLEWVTEAPQLDQGFIAELERWRKSVPVPTLVIIDVLQRIKPAGSMARNSYENDYSAWAPLQQWSTENRVAVLGLHHTKKGGADDPLEALSGSNGLSACADTTIVLDQDQNGRTLYVRGRDVEEKETAVIFNGGLWSVLGNAAEVHRSDERSVIIAAIDDNSEPMTPLEIADATGKPRANVRQLLRKMAKAEQLHKIGARYWTQPVYPGHNDNSDHREQDD